MDVKQDDTIPKKMLHKKYSFVNLLLSCLEGYVTARVGLPVSKITYCYLQNVTFQEMITSWNFFWWSKIKGGRSK